MNQSEVEREVRAEELLDQLTPLMATLGVLFVLTAIGEQLATSDLLQTAFRIATWAIWSAFFVEFLIRLWIAPDWKLFLRRHWWQVIFLIIPVLRVLRIFQSLRFLRTSRVLSGTLRSTRSAARAITDRVMWLALTTLIVILSAAEMLYEFGDFEKFSDALRASAIAAIAGESMSQEGYLARFIEFGLLTYSVVVVATLAGSLGAFFLDSQRRP